MSPVEQDQLIRNHLNLVRSIARRVAAFTSSTVEFEDLVSYGHQGLVQAARRFAPERGVAFSTFAYYRIRGAILDGIRESGPCRHIQRRIKFESRANEILERASRGEQPKSDVDAAKKLAGLLTELAKTYVDVAHEAPAEQDRLTPSPYQYTERREQLDIVKSGMKRKLSSKERKLLSLVYFDDMEMMHAANEMGISKGWASRLHKSALGKLSYLRKTTNYIASSESLS